MKTMCDKNEAERRPPGAKKILDGVHRMRPPSWLTPSRAKSVVCAVEGRAYSPWLDYLFLAPPFLAPPFLAPPFLAPPFFAPPFAAFLVAISCSCSFSFFGVPHHSWSGRFSPQDTVSIFILWPRVNGAQHIGIYKHIEKRCQQLNSSAATFFSRAQFE